MIRPISIMHRITARSGDATRILKSSCPLRNQKICERLSFSAYDPLGYQGVMWRSLALPNSISFIKAKGGIVVETASARTSYEDAYRPLATVFVPFQRNLNNWDVSLLPADSTHFQHTPKKFVNTMQANTVVCVGFTERSGGASLQLRHFSTDKIKMAPKYFDIRKWGLSEWANFASILCVLDCTVLPALMTVVSVAGIITPEGFRTLHKISSWAAVYIMAPLALVASTSNFMQLRHKILYLWGLFGISLVLAAHLPIPFISEEKQQLKQNYGGWISLVGVVSILSSNLVSRRRLHMLGECHRHHHTGRSHSHSQRSAVKVVKTEEAKPLLGELESRTR